MISVFAILDLMQFQKLSSLEQIEQKMGNTQKKKKKSNIMFLRLEYFQYHTTFPISGEKQSYTAYA